MQARQSITQASMSVITGYNIYVPEIFDYGGTFWLHLVMMNRQIMEKFNTLVSAIELLITEFTKGLDG